MGQIQQNISNFWIFWSITLLIYHLLKSAKHFLNNLWTVGQISLIQILNDGLLAELQARMCPEVADFAVFLSHT